MLLIYPSVQWYSPASITGFIGVCLGTAGSILSIFIPKEFVYHFKKNDWIKIEPGSYILKISYNIHKISKNPKANVYELYGDKYKNVIMGDINYDDYGNIELISCELFCGKVKIH